MKITKGAPVQLQGRGVQQIEFRLCYYCESWNYVIIYVRHSKTRKYNSFIFK